jgi:hypothetical protein
MLNSCICYIPSTSTAEPTRHRYDYLYIIPLSPLACLPYRVSGYANFSSSFLSLYYALTHTYTLSLILFSSNLAFVFMPRPSLPSHVTNPYHGEVKQTRSSHPRVQILPRGKLLLPSQRGRPDPLQQQKAVVKVVLLGRHQAVVAGLPAVVGVESFIIPAEPGRRPHRL